MSEQASLDVGAIEQKVSLETDPAKARALGRKQPPLITNATSRPPFARLRTP